MELTSPARPWVYVLIGCGVLTALAAILVAVRHGVPDLRTAMVLLTCPAVPFWALKEDVSPSRPDHPYRAQLLAVTRIASVLLTVALLAGALL